MKERKNKEERCEEERQIYIYSEIKEDNEGGTIVTSAQFKRLLEIKHTS